jgi:hypothetical protein
MGDLYLFTLVKRHWIYGSYKVWQLTSTMTVLTFSTFTPMRVSIIQPICRSYFMNHCTSYGYISCQWEPTVWEKIFDWRNEQLTSCIATGYVIIYRQKINRMSLKYCDLTNETCYMFVRLKINQSHYRPVDRSWGFQEVEAPRFQNSQHMKVARLSALRTGSLYPQEIFQVPFSVRGWVDPRAIVRPEGLCQWKSPVTPLGIRPATFQFVV